MAQTFTHIDAVGVGYLDVKAYSSTSGSKFWHWLWIICGFSEEFMLQS